MCKSFVTLLLAVIFGFSTPVYAFFDDLTVPDFKLKEEALTWPTPQKFGQIGDGKVRVIFTPATIHLISDPLKYRTVLRESGLEHAVFIPCGALGKLYCDQAGEIMIKLALKPACSSFFLGLIDLSAYRRETKVPLLFGSNRLIVYVQQDEFAGASVLNRKDSKPTPEQANIFNACVGGVIS